MRGPRINPWDCAPYNQRPRVNLLVPYAITTSTFQEAGLPGSDPGRGELDSHSPQT